MNQLIIIAVVATMGCARPTEQGVSLSQDTLGNYNLKFATDDTSRDEQGYAGGKVVGSYSYTNKDGYNHKITYATLPNGGFVAEGDVPQQVQETPEVAEARRSHLAIVEKERELLPPLKEEAEIAEVQEIVYVPTAVAHKQTAATQTERLAAHEHALAALAEEYKRISAAI